MPFDRLPNAMLMPVQDGFHGDIRVERVVEAIDFDCIASHRDASSGRRMDGWSMFLRYSSNKVNMMVPLEQETPVCKSPSGTPAR